MHAGRGRRLSAATQLIDRKSFAGVELGRVSKSKLGVEGAGLEIQGAKTVLPHCALIGARLGTVHGEQPRSHTRRGGCNDLTHQAPVYGFLIARVRVGRRRHSGSPRSAVRFGDFVVHIHADRTCALIPPKERERKDSLLRRLPDKIRSLR